MQLIAVSTPWLLVLHLFVTISQSLVGRTSFAYIRSIFQEHKKGCINFMGTYNEWHAEKCKNQRKLIPVLLQYYPLSHGLIVNVLSSNITLLCAELLHFHRSGFCTFDSYVTERIYLSEYYLPCYSSMFTYHSAEQKSD